MWAGGGGGRSERECEVLVGCRGGGWTPRAACANECVLRACVGGRRGGIPALSQPALSVSMLA